MPENETRFTRGEMFILGWQYSFSGEFDEYLARAMCKADLGNLAKLRMGFPEEVGAMKLYREAEGWWGNLQKRYLSILPGTAAEICTEGEDTDGTTEKA